MRQGTPDQLKRFQRYLCSAASTQNLRYAITPIAPGSNMQRLVGMRRVPCGNAGGVRTQTYGPALQSRHLSPVPCSRRWRAASSGVMYDAMRAPQTPVAPL